MDHFSNALQSIHGALAVDAEVLGETIKVIDKTSGADLNFGAAGTQPDIMPACVVRAAVLDSTGLSLEDIQGETITFNGRTWRIINYKARPTPEGEDAGEYYLFLRKAS